ncbi:acyltransferase family protein [Devosia rhizoryzae]|uniref:Acyltransferase n=1 Tax=Devosia rhizoryzae TaxID=2774137 RepID=A0ABX7CA68_9HYPH|nr:acyltransferase [Devosia rhizoryzae]QQR41001.1 acyltransferase [Devosia rhizoryzae]
MSEPNRLHGADFLRALACIAVVIHHLAARMDMGRVPEAVQPLIKFFVMGSFGVTVFFVLSGYLLARPFWLALDAGEPMPSMRIYWMRRLARIVPGFWLALVVSLVLDLWIGNAVADGQTLFRFFAGALLVSDWHWVTLFPVDNNGPLWSIGFEVTSYLLLPLCLGLLFAAGRKGWTSRLLWLPVIGLVLGAHALIVVYAPIDDVERGWDHGLIGGAKAWMPFYNPVGFFAVFALGSLASGVQVMLKSWRHPGFDVLGVAAVLVAGMVMALHIGGPTEGYGWLQLPYGFPWMPLAMGVALVALSLSVRVGKWLDGGPVRFIAKISFGIYIWHFLLMWLAPFVWPPAFRTWEPDGWSNWLLTSAGVIAATLIVATLSFYLIEQPAVRWARRLEKRSVRGEPATA